jgi:uncharacterized low-complexity protein
MSKKSSIKPVAAALGTAFAITLATAPVANAASNPFGMADLNAGYSVAMGDKPKEGKCGEAKCGAEKKAEGKCGEKKGEAKCGAKKSEATCGAKK